LIDWLKVAAAAVVDAAKMKMAAYRERWRPIRRHGNWLLRQRAFSLPLQSDESLRRKQVRRRQNVEVLWSRSADSALTTAYTIR